MKQLLLSITFLFIFSISYSQERAKQLTDVEKDVLRKNHKTGLTFKSKSETNTSTLKTSNSTEQDVNAVKTIKVKHYYGKQDSLFKEFEYPSN